MLDGPYQRLGNYRVIRQLGSGAFAIVYLGEHKYLQTQAAIKVLQMQVVGNDLERFLAEARTIARLRHPSIVGLLEFGIDDHTPFLVMEYAPYGSLRQRHSRGSRLSPAEIVSYIRQITTGLQYAHDEKLIHRDIKPENLLLDADGNVLLSDFGTALVAQTRYHQTQEIAGTPRYMAPEQLRGRPVQASDQYALGIVVYEWLSGFCPFCGSFPEVAAQHLSVNPPSLCTRFPDIPSTVEQVVMTALAKNPQERFANVLAFARALEGACQSGVAPQMFSLSNSLPYFAPPSVLTKSLTTEHSLRQLPDTEPPQQPVSLIYQKPRRLSVPFVSRTMLFFLLAVLLVVGSGWSYYHWIVSSPVPHAQAASAMNLSSNDLMQIYATATGGKPDYATSMSQNDSSGNWEENSSCIFSKGTAYYAYAGMQQNGASPCLATGINVYDFAYQVQMTISTGGEGGLIFRSDNVSVSQDVDQDYNYTLNNYYFFSISQNGRYSLYYYQSDKSQRQLATGSSPEINKGLNQTNMLTVIAHGSDIYLYVNGHSIAHVKDSTRLSGYFGVFARSDTTATTVQFSNAKIWNLS